MARLKSDYMMVMGFSILFGLLFWLVDGYFEYVFFHRNLKFLLLEGPETLAQSLFIKVPMHSLFVRISFIAAACLGGILLSFFLYRKNLYQNKLHHLNSVLMAVRNVNQLIVKETDPGRLIEQACVNLTETMGYRNTWIALLGGEEGNTLGLPSRGAGAAAAAAGFDGDFEAMRRRLERGEFPACMKRALDTDNAVVFGDPASDCSDCILSVDYGGRAALTRSLAFDGVTYGVLTASVPASYARDAEEQDLFNEVAGDLAFALHKIAADRRLEETRDRFRLVFEAANVGKSITLPTGEVDVNKAFAGMLGYAPEELRGKTWQELTPPEDVPKTERRIAPLLDGREDATRFEKRYLRKNGGAVWTDVSVTIRRDSQNRPLHFITTVVDITERKKTEKSLKEAYDIINRSSSVAFTWKNQEGWPVEFVSENVEKLFGYTAEEFITGEVNYAGCLHPEDLQRVAKELAEFSSKDDAAGFFHEPYRILTKYGSDKIIRDRGFIVRDNDGRITHYKGIVEDITEQKNLEQQLLQAQKLEAVGRLSAGIAHDFNNLLCTVIGNADLILSALPRNNQSREEIEEIKAAGERAATLTRQLLAFSRKQVFQPAVMNLNDTVRDMEKMLRRMIVENIDLKINPAPDLGLIEADVGQIEQVIMNLVVNARDAMPTGGRLTIETENVDLDEAYPGAHIAVNPGPYVMLSVSDTGIGISKEVQSRLFEPFFTTKEKGKGTGLGLSTAYGIVKQSNGNIWLYSEPDQGSTFKIYLPRVDKPAPGTKTKAERAEAPTGSETVLVVEDDEMVRKFAVRVLKGYGYRVLEASNGDEAIETAEGHQGHIGLLLTDVVMPGMSGKEMEEGLRASRPEMKALFMSGYTDNAIVHHGVLDKGTNFLQKPFTPDSLARKVREALGD